MLDAWDNSEQFLHTDDNRPALMYATLAHAQFETLYPFFDGNGAVGRQLICIPARPPRRAAPAAAVLELLLQAASGGIL
jgi:hypothetical protein